MGLAKLDDEYSAKHIQGDDTEASIDKFIDGYVSLVEPYEEEEKRREEAAAREERRLKRKFGEECEDSEESEEEPLDPLLDDELITAQYTESMIKALAPYDNEHFKIADFIEELGSMEGEEDYARWAQKAKRDELLAGATPDEAALIDKYIPEPEARPEPKKSEPVDDEEDFIEFEEDSMFNPMMGDEPKESKKQQKSGK